MKCQICGAVTKSKGGLSVHIGRTHKDVVMKEYYDAYFKVDGEDKCKSHNCKNAVGFNTLGAGYKNNYGREKYCSVSCARCDDEVQQKQNETCLKKYGAASFRNAKQRESTCLEKYGAINVLSKGTSVSEKRDQTVLAKYGVKNVFQSKEIIQKCRDAHEKTGYWTDFTNISYADYREYYRLAWRYFKSIREAFMKTWDGYDYYDGTYIRKNLALNSSLSDYPTVDHKISIRECLLMGKTVQEASAFDNLCVTKKGLNSQKKCKSEEEFREWLLGKK